MVIFKKHHREYLIILLLSLFMTTIGGFLIFNKIRDRAFSSQHFKAKQISWHQYPNFAAHHLEAQNLYHTFAQTSHKIFYQKWYDLIKSLPPSYDIYYLASSKKEIRAMADQLIENIYQNYPDHEFRFFDRLFARDPALSILLDEPQSYLFILSTKLDANLLIFATMQPTLDGGFVQSNLWYFDREDPPSSDFLSNIFTIYHKKIR